MKVLKKFELKSVKTFFYLFFILLTLLLWSFLSGVFKNPFTKETYAAGEIEIYYLQDLDEIKNDLTASYILMNDLDFNDDASYDPTDPNSATKKTAWTTGEGWYPIGTYPTYFTGTFDGQNHTISNLYINRPTWDEIAGVGLFGDIGHPTPGIIRNLNLENIYVTGTQSLGGLVGHNFKGTVSNCHVTGTVIGYGDYANYVGGLIGFSEKGNTESSSFSGSVSGVDDVGGLIGYHYDDYYGSLLTQSFSSGTVTGEYAVGGLVGSSTGLTIESCHSSSSVNAIGDYYYFGGLVGENNGTPITNSYAQGDVTAPNCEGVGGLVGYSYGNLESSYATGDVSGNTYVGGLIGDGYGYGDFHIYDSYASGSVTGVDYVGGFAGENSGEINNSYSTGSVIGSTNIGGFIGGDWGVVSNSFWDNEASDMATSPVATGKTTAQMQSISTFNNTSTEGLDTVWDITEYNLFIPPNSNIWFIEDTYSYPHLFYEYDEYIPLAVEETEPTVSTIAATDIAPVSAKLNANLTEVGTYGTPVVYFQYRKIGGDWSSTAQTSKGIVGTYSLNLINLTPNTKYEFRAAVNFDDSSINYGSILSFTTLTSNTEDTIQEDITLQDIRITDIGLIDNIPNLSFLSYHFTSTIVRIKGVTSANSYIIFETDEKGYRTQSNEKGNFELVMQLTERSYEFDYYTYDNLGNKSKVRELTLIIDTNYIENYQDEEEDEITEEVPPVENIDNSVPEKDIPPVTQEPEEKKNLFGEKVRDFIRGITITEKQSKDIAVGSLISLPLLTALSLAFGNTYIWALLIRVFSYILALFKIGKKKRNCGLVYNSVTKEPLGMAIVRIFSKEGRLVATEVTNQYGIFESSLPSDTYKLDINMNGYVFPSSLIAGNQDLPYRNIYTGGDFNLSNHPISYSVPIDPLNKSVLQEIKTVVRNRFINISISLINIVILIGLLFSILSYIKVPNTFNLVLLILYILTLVITIVMNSQGKYRFGTVRDIYEERLEGVELSLMETEFGTNFARRITDEKGKYRFIVPGGEYKLVSTDPDYNIMVDRESIFKGKKDKVMVISNNLIARKR